MRREVPSPAPASIATTLLVDAVARRRAARPFGDRLAPALRSPIKIGKLKEAAADLQKTLVCACVRVCECLGVCVRVCVRVGSRCLGVECGVWFR